MYKKEKPSPRFYVIVVLYSSLLIYPIYAYLKGFYDPFYPTSCVPLEEILHAQTEVFRHARFYYTYYPLSLILNSILNKILNINCLDIGLLPILSFVDLLFFHVLLHYYTRSHNEKTLLLYLYAFIMISILNKTHPLFYITLGNTAYFIFLYLLLVFVRKNTNSTSSFISLFLLALLGMFSYYTAGFSLNATLLLTLILYIVHSVLTVKTKPTRLLYVVLVINTLYLSFENIFYQQLEDIYSLVSIENLINVFSRGEQNSLSYNFNTPLGISVVQRISLYLLLAMSTTFVVLTLLKIFFKDNGVQLPLITLASATLASYILSLYYSFLMSTIYLRYYIYFYIVAIPLFFRTQKTRLRTLLYSLIAFIAVSNLLSTIYVVLNSDTFLSQYTTYFSEHDYDVICNFLKNPTQTAVFSDLKTSFTLPIKCDNPNILVNTFKTEFFFNYNKTHNLLENAKSGIYIYASSYARNGIYLWNWKYYKPFILRESEFGILLNTGHMKLYIK